MGRGDCEVSIIRCQPCVTPNLDIIFIPYLLPLYLSSRALKIPLQIWLGFEPNVALRKSTLFKIRVTSLSGYEMIDQPSFPNRAILNRWRFLIKFILPMLFGAHKSSHLSHLTPFAGFVPWPHQKNKIIIHCNSSMKVHGNRKVLIVYAGMAWAAVFKNISLPAFDSFLFLQPCSLFHRISTQQRREA